MIQNIPKINQRMSFQGFGVKARGVSAVNVTRAGMNHSGIITRPFREGVVTSGVERLRGIFPFFKKSSDGLSRAVNEVREKLNAKIASNYGIKVDSKDMTIPQLNAIIRDFEKIAKLAANSGAELSISLSALKAGQKTVPGFKVVALRPAISRWQKFKRFLSPYPVGKSTTRVPLESVIIATREFVQGTNPKIGRSKRKQI